MVSESDIRADGVRADVSTQADRLLTLNEIGRVVSSALDLPSLYGTIYEQVGRVMDASLFLICVQDPDSDRIDIPYLREEGKLFEHQEVPEGNSLTRLVIETGQYRLFNSNDEYLAHAHEQGLPDLTVGEQLPESMLFVPLNTGQRTIGVLSVQSLRPNAYTPDDVQTLSVISSQAAVAIVNARLYEQSQLNVAQMQALLQAARTVNSSLDLQSVLDAILSEIRQVLPYYLAVIFLPNESEQALEIMGAVGEEQATRRIESLRRTLKISFGRGVTGLSYVRGEPVLAPEVSAFPDYIDHGVSVSSEVAIPLKRGDQVVGVLDVERDGLAFTDDDVALLSLFASQAAIAIENARLYGEQQRRVHELQTIESIVQKLTPLHEIPVIAETIDAELQRLIDYHACRLFMLDANGENLVSIISSGSNLTNVSLRVGEGFAGWVAETGKPLIVDNSLLDERAAQIPGTPRREESIMGAPLVFEDRVQGVITLSKLGIGQFDENAVRLLEIVAGQAAIVFDRARLYDELRTEAITDPLTKLYNRRYLIERLKEEQARAIRSHQDLAAIMLDLDKFKGVNDRFGHDAGDAVLQAVASIIRAVVRTEDIVARYGGEEFCVLLPDLPAGDAERVAERLRHRIERTRLPAEAGISQITVSVGIARLAPDDRSTELFSRADAAMYQGKHAGGNAVFIAHGDAVHRLDPPPEQ